MCYKKMYPEDYCVYFGELNDKSNGLFEKAISDRKLNDFQEDFILWFIVDCIEKQIKQCEFSRNKLMDKFCFNTWGRTKNQLLHLQKEDYIELEIGRGSKSNVKITVKY